MSDLGLRLRRLESMVVGETNVPIFWVEADAEHYTDEDRRMALETGRAAYKPGDPWIVASVERAARTRGASQ